MMRIMMVMGVGGCGDGGFWGWMRNQSGGAPRLLLPS